MIPIPAGQSDGAVHESSLRDIATVIFSHKLKMLLFFMVVFGLVALGTYSVPETYESEVKLLLRPGRESAELDPTVPASRAIFINRTMEEHLHSEIEILRSRELAEAVVESITAEKLLSTSRSAADSGGLISRVRGFARSASASLGSTLGLTCKLEPEEQAIELITSNMSAEVVRTTNIVVIRFQSKNSEMAHEVLAEFLKAYFLARPRIYATGGARAYFLAKVEETRDTLEEAEEALRDYKNKAGVISINNQRLLGIERLNDVEAEAARMSARLAGQRATVASLQAEIKTLKPTIILQQKTGAPNFYMDEARFPLLELRVQEQEALQQYPEDGHIVKSIQSRIKAAEKILSGEKTTLDETVTGVNTAFQELSVQLGRDVAELKNLEGQTKVLDKSMSDVRKHLTKLNESEFQLSRLERNRQMADANYRAYASRLEEVLSAEAQQQQAISNVSVVQSATHPVMPVMPNKPLNLALGFIVGLLGSFGLAFVCSWLDHSLRSDTQVEQKLGIPVLASIPQMRRNERHR